MSILTVIRHGQASFLAENYDKLSPLGERQSLLLGQYWLAQGASFDQVYYGPRERQIRTGEIIGSGFQKAGLSWPTPVVVPDLDEYPAEAVLGKFSPILIERHPHLKELSGAFYQTEDLLTKQRAIDKLLKDVTRRWMDGEVSDPDIPTWQDFCTRVESAMAAIMEQAPKASRVAVFTSGGPTAATARMALGLTHQATLDLTWSPRNASFSEFLFSGKRMTMSAFNHTPHLPQPDLLTYR
ncbi:MAG: histidine phosphatase family protein [Acidobacteriia bacterium]|nr:histidine phosphatase family protein [Terriglobia bacterium]